MSVRLSYEPSVEGLVWDLLGADARLAGEPGGWRNRVSWPVALRATGLGSLQGGEIIIVPAGREREMLARLEELHRAGVAALAVERDPSPAGSLPADAAVPIVATPLAAEPRKLKEEIERYVMRRRRELFSLDQRLHRVLVDAALSGASMERLVELAREGAGVVAVEAGGELWTTGATRPDTLDTELRRAERAVAAGSVAVLRESGEVILAAPLEVAGRRRGVVAVRVDELARIDEREVLAVTLSAAAAIVLARSPGVEIGSLDTVVQQADREPAPNGGWWCAAFAADESDRRRLARAVLADVSARDLGVLLAVEGDVLYCLLTLAMVPGWPREIGRRAGLSRVRAGLSDGTGRGLSARRASQQAGDALRLGTLDVTAFPDVELDALLGRLDGWQDFVERKLGPLLSSPELVASLDAYLRDRNVTQAAARLSVHRNTLIYRLKRCRDLLGVDVDDPRASFSLMLALHLMSAHRDRS